MFTIIDTINGKVRSSHASLEEARRKLFLLRQTYGRNHGYAIRQASESGK